MIDKLMSHENIIKLVGSACVMAYQFNTKSGWINQEHNKYIDTLFRLYYLIEKKFNMTNISL